MRISDWSSDVCSSDLVQDSRLVVLNAMDAAERGAEVLTRVECLSARREGAQWRVLLRDRRSGLQREEIGRASCRERVCQYVWISVVAVSLKKKHSSVYTQRLRYT